MKTAEEVAEEVFAQIIGDIGFARVPSEKIIGPIAQALTAYADERLEHQAQLHAKLRRETWFIDGYKKALQVAMEAEEKSCGCTCGGCNCTNEIGALIKPPSGATSKEKP